MKNKKIVFDDDGFPFYVDKKMKNGLGVVLDDLLAGIYVLIIFALFGHFFGPPFE